MPGGKPTEHIGDGAQGPRLTLCVLGELTASVAGRRLPLATRKAKALVGYLALSTSGSDTRERLVGLFWSESDEHHARASLRQAIHEIRAACTAVGFTGFSTDRQTLGLARGHISSDVDEILARLDAREVDDRLLQSPRLADTLLEQLDGVDPAFHVWIRTKRQLLHDRLTTALEGLLPREGEPGEATAAAMALLSLDPTHELACRHLIRNRSARGDVGGAMKVYKTLWDVLDQDYDIEPSRETQELIVGIKQDAGLTDAPAAAAAEPKPAVAPRGKALWNRLMMSVGHFDAAGVPDDRRYIVNGFRHELLACLSRFREWSVRALGAKETIEPRSWSSPPEYLIEGTAYEGAGTIHLIITLRDASTGVCIWSQRCALTLETWVWTQQQIIRQIASALNVHLSAERLRRTAGEDIVSLDLHDRWLRGQDLVHTLTSANWRSARAIFENLVEDAADYAPALTSLVQMSNTEHIARPGHFRDPANQAEAMVLALRAVRLDPLDCRAQLNLAWTHQLAGRTAEATLHAGLAVDLNSNDPWTLMSCGQIFAYCGEYDRARSLAETSLSLVPVATPQQMTYLSVIAFLAGDYEACVEAARQGLDASPGFCVWECAALAHLQRTEEAAAVLDRAFERIAADWHGADEPAPEAMASWLLNIFPIAVEADRQRLAAGLAKAGAPVAAEATGGHDSADRLSAGV